MIRRRVCGTVLLIAAMLVAPGVAPAQILPPWPLLPIEFAPSVTIEERYTDNFFNTKTKVADYRTTLSPAFSLGTSTGRNRSDLRYQLSVSHSNDTTEPQIFNSLTGTDTLSLSDRFSLVIRERLSQSDEPGTVDIRGIQAQGARINSNQASLTLGYQGDQHGGTLVYSTTSTVRTVAGGAPGATGGASATPAGAATPEARFESTSDSFVLGGKFFLGPQTSLDGSTSYSRAESGATGVTTTGTTTSSTTTGYDTSLGVRRELPGEMTLGVSGGYTLRHADVGGDVTIMRGSLTVTRPLTASISGTLSGGYDTVQGGVQTSGLNGSLALSYQGALLRADLSGSQAVRETFQDHQSAGLILTRDARLGVSYTPTDRLSFTASGSIAQTEFLQPEIAAGQGLVAHTTPGSSTETTTYTFDLGLSFRLSQRVAGRIAYAYRTRFVTVSSGGSTSSSNAGNVDVNTLTAGLTMTYD